MIMAVIYKSNSRIDNEMVVMIVRYNDQKLKREQENRRRGEIIKRN